MGRKRRKNKELPPRVYVHHGSYRYQPKDGKKVTLAREGDYGGMLRALADLTDVASQRTNLDTIAAIIDRYELEVLPQKAKSTQANERRYLKNLRRTFGLMRPRDFRAHHAATYRDKRGRKAPTAANHEIGLLSHVFSMAGEWGAVDRHPMKGLVRKISRPPRRRYVTDQEFAAMLSHAPPMIAWTMQLALLTGLRRGDILRIRRSDLTNDGVVVSTSKTDVALLFEWSDEFRAVIREALAYPPQVRQFVICNRWGRAYNKNTFDNDWKRTCLAYEATGGERFQFRDLRRKNASDEDDEQVASARLGHKSIEITRRVYRVKPKIVKPLR